MGRPYRQFPPRGKVPFPLGPPWYMGPEGPWLPAGNPVAFSTLLTMSTTVEDYQLAAAAAGFTIGFGFLEIIVNVCIGVVGWLFLTGVLGPT